MIINFDNIEIIIKKLKNPLQVLILLAKNKKMLTDDDLTMIIRYFMRHHFDEFIDNDFYKCIKLFGNYEKSQDLIYSFYDNITKKIELLYDLKKFKKAYNRKYFWSMKIDKQKDYLFNLYNEIRAINDNSIGNFTFLNKFNINDKSLNNDINISEIFNRLVLMYKKVGINFFKTYKIKIISGTMFEDLSFKQKVYYFEYIYDNIIENLDKVINNFTLYDCLTSQMNNIISPKKIEIVLSPNIIDVDIDF